MQLGVRTLRMITDPARAMTAQFYFQIAFKENGILISFSTKTSGIMDVPQRWEVIRRAIEFYKFADKNFGLRGRPSRDSYGSAFERATGIRISQETAA